MKTSTEITILCAFFGLCMLVYTINNPLPGLLLSTAMGLVAALIVWLVRSRQRRRATARQRETVVTTEGWHAPDGWSYQPSDSTLSQRWRDAGLTLMDDDTVWNVLLSEDEAMPVAVFQTQTERGARTWCLVWAGELHDFSATTGRYRSSLARDVGWDTVTTLALAGSLQRSRSQLDDMDVLEPVEGSFSSPDVAAALAELEFDFASVDTHSPFLVARLARNDPEWVIGALIVVSDLVALAEALRDSATVESPVSVDWSSEVEPDPVEPSPVEPRAVPRLDVRPDPGSPTVTTSDPHAAPDRWTESTGNPPTPDQAVPDSSPSRVPTWQASPWRPTEWQPPDYRNQST